MHSYCKLFSMRTNASREVANRHGNQVEDSVATKSFEQHGASQDRTLRSFLLKVPTLRCSTSKGAFGHNLYRSTWYCTCHAKFRVQSASKEDLGGLVEKSSTTTLNGWVNEGFLKSLESNIPLSAKT